MGKLYLSKSAGQTKKIGRIMAEGIKKRAPSKKAFILGLIGDLGGGKTTFLQGFARGLGIREKITSPTFIIMKKISIPQKRKSGFNCFYHIDCYRIKKTKEILDLNLKKIISLPRNIIAIEWADKIKKILPKDTLFIKFDFKDKNKRKILIN